MIKQNIINGLAMEHRVNIHNIDLFEAKKTSPILYDCTYRIDLRYCVIGFKTRVDAGGKVLSVERVPELDFDIRFRGEAPEKKR